MIVGIDESDEGTAVTFRDGDQILRVITGDEAEKFIRDNVPSYNTEQKFLKDIINITTGWRLEGCETHEQALRMIQDLCEKRLAYKRRPQPPRTR